MVGRFFGKKPPADEVPVCPVHKTPMVLRAKLGKPVRFTNQQTQAYTLIFRCALPTCNETIEIERVRGQVPVPGELPDRPSWAKRS
ncbi:hypothetical protein [Nitrolancea hollandica]|uniref:Uncharacterized protein n=1 Tax=Nitrolancea hollandica Lb TaxID=1129897 RepID=I4EEK7_9BACT|nr:hypothetical protein [Nitrolancea hollandica]CCF83119.1 hypothetical protein NITHO_1880006 [Nitrolancea hollandica Lb]